MLRNIKLLPLLILVLLAGMSGCKKDEYSFGDIKTPTNLTLTTVIEGADVSNPNGNGTGKVNIASTAESAISYKVDYGDGRNDMVPSGAITHKYTSPGTNTYTITVNAIGTGGVISTISKTITVFVAFEIPLDMITAFTNGSSKTWVTDRGTPGHFGVGPADAFLPIWYEAGPDSREACAYDDEITFSKDALNRISMLLDNKGASFSIGAAAGFYGFSGGDACYAINPGAIKLLSFMDATSTSTAAQSTRIQFVVPGNGIVNFGTGGTTYEIISFSATQIFIRNIGADGNSWYQKLKPKP
ncbi:MAG: hypothetical protein EOP51_12375 [Sphingobacteriales bacterium]|nr:MAG: hypothetical protein EOP51_12375 [Sphingobacteriales bacterium]